MTSNRPRALSPIVRANILPSELFEYVLEHHTAPTNIIICSTREAFLTELLTSVHNAHPPAPPGDAEAQESLHDPTPTHPLLIPTIHLLFTSSTINIAFCPTLQHLRAYLTTYSNPTLSLASSSSQQGVGIPMLVVMDAIGLHRSTSDYSAQGLSRTFAVAVEAAARERMKLVITESEYSADEEGGSEQIDLWEEQVPLLNGTFRGLNGEGRGWVGRTVKIRSVAERWCVFERYTDFNEDNDDIRIGRGTVQKASTNARDQKT
ncbi:MAG: hypothetical protein M1827_002335 [Pycnora praestabilis]|nr:MAG: hypothetical protein M1827_002335 [Pycnora praestabilis]